jgi:iron complex outermembrane receptor protein
MKIYMYSKFIRPALFACLMLCLIQPALAQTSVSGKVTSGADGNVVPGVSIILKGDPGKGTLTDSNGLFTLSAKTDDVLIISFIGFKTKEVRIDGTTTQYDIALEEASNQLSEVIVTGTRSTGRTAIETPVPVDVISISDVMGDMPQLDLAQMLAALAPSFNAVRSQFGDLNSHVDPAQLRNLAPNQTLVLVNGKRRHTSALLITSTAVGSPSTSVDLMTIPASSIERVEILRDGAAAQYGSDAVAGVINIVLKKGTDKLTGSFTGGGYLNSGGSGEAKDLTASHGPDGYNYQFTANYGFKIGTKGFINISGELTQRRPTLRPLLSSGGFYDNTYLQNLRTDKYGNPVITNPELVSALGSGNEAQAALLQTSDGLMAARGLDREDFSTFAGMPGITLGSTFYNAEYAINENATLYMFGGLAYKFVKGYSCYFRTPGRLDRFSYLLYPNGFRPQMTTNTSDISNTVGLRAKAGSFNMDFSNTFGRNKMRIGMENTFNASIGSNSPVNMNLGTHQFTQNTTNLDFSRGFKDILHGLNIAFGAEMRVENYKILRGQEESYAFGDAGIITAERDGLLTGPNGLPLENNASKPIVDANGNPVQVLRGDQVIVKSTAANCQCFAGFGPKNERDEFRTNVALYADAELDITEDLLVEGAVRLENYSDFGKVTTGKIAMRYSILDNLSVRASVSTGYRAPSLQELNYTHTATAFYLDASGVLQPSDETTYPTNSTAARVLGIQGLKQEKSKSFGAGFTYQYNQQFEFTADAYQIDVDDRIFQTTTFTPEEVGNNYEEIIGPQGLAQFFINAGDVRTRGIELVANYTASINATSGLTFSLASIISKNEFLDKKVQKLNTNLTEDELIEKYLSRSSEGQFRYGTPRTKIIGSVHYRVSKFSALLRGTYFGKVTDWSIQHPDGNYYDQTFSGQTVFDLSLSYDITSNLRFSIGSNNIFDKYPDLYRAELRDAALYSNNQQGSGGAYYYGRIMFNF